MQSGSLRFVILCDSLDLPLWQANCIREAVCHGVAQPVGIVLKAAPPSSRARSKWHKRWKERGLFLWRLFNRVYVDRLSKATRSVSVPEILGKLPTVVDAPVRVGAHGEALSPSALEFIRDVRPDFLLRFGFGILKGEVLTCAKYGVWSYHHGDPAKYRGQPPGFWEIVAGSPVAGAILQVLGDELDGGSILHRGFFQTALHSYVKTRDTLYLGSSSWVRRTCADILRNGWRVGSNSVSSAPVPILKEPRNRVMLRFMFRTAINFLKTQIRYRLYRQIWNCGVVAAPIHVVAGFAGEASKARALAATRWMPAEPGAFRADPFAYELNDPGQIRILFENFDWSTKLGSIAAVDYDGAEFGPRQPILSTHTHLSYPYILTEDDVIRFIPENSAARNISAYHITMSGQPERKTALVTDCDLVDATFFRWQGKYWMFALDETQTKNTDLHIYFSDRLEGPWKAHPLNPVKTDVLSARPGGTPFVHAGKLYRPAQDCSTHYGSAIVVNEVKVLNETDFEEQTVSRVEPLIGGGYEHGLHTMSEAGASTLIDGARKEPIFGFAFGR